MAASANPDAEHGNLTALIRDIPVASFDIPGVVYANIEGAQTARSNVHEGVGAIAAAISMQIALYTGDTLMQQWAQTYTHLMPHDQLTAMLTAWAQMQDKPTVLSSFC